MVDISELDEIGFYDIISMDVVWAGEFAAAGYLEPLNALIKDQGWKPTDFNAGSMALGKYKGKNYVLSYFSDLGFMYYRKDIVSSEDAAKLESGDYESAVEVFQDALYNVVG